LLLPEGKMGEAWEPSKKINPFWEIREHCVESTGLFEMIVGVLTTCHKQYT